MYGLSHMVLWQPLSFAQYIVFFTSCMIYSFCADILIFCDVLIISRIAVIIFKGRSSFA